MAKKKKYNERELLLQPNLFGEDFFSSAITTSVETAETTSLELKIQKSLKQSLSKQQKRFNQLIQKIENYEKEIKDTKALGTELSAFYIKNILPVEKDFGEACFVWVKVLHEFALLYKLTEKQREKLDCHILEICNVAISYTEPTEDQVTFYDSYSFISYREKINSEMIEVVDNFNDFMREEMNIDLEDMHFNQEDVDNAQEYINKLNEKLKSKLNEHQQLEQSQTKSKKEIEKEQQKILEAEVTRKSLRSVYISLAKILHPDTETDEQLRNEKSELMKKVTVAYEQKDLATLLKLEIEWVHKTAEKLQLLSEEKLKLYNGVLQDQLNELQNELFTVKMNPAFVNVATLLGYDKKYALKILKENKNDLLTEIEQIKVNIMAFRRQPTKKTTLINYLKNVELEEDEDKDFFDDILRDLIYNS